MGTPSCTYRHGQYPLDPTERQAAREQHRRPLRERYALALRLAGLCMNCRADVEYELATGKHEVHGQCRPENCLCEHHEQAGER